MRTVLWLVCGLLAAGCGDDAIASEPDGGDARADAGDKDHGHDVREVACVDQSIAMLSLFDVAASGGIREEGDTPGEFTTYIDATGGGMNATQSYVYARFTAQGLEKLELSDEEAFESTAWHIAFRRYVIRLNSGVSGPGEVTAARTRPMTDFATLTAAPPDLEYRTEQYYTENCEYVADTSGIGAPATALASFWSYSGCVQMTGNVYVLSLPGDKFVKFQVLAYYPPANQELCDQSGQTATPSGAGNMRVRWGFLE